MLDDVVVHLQLLNQCCSILWRVAGKVTMKKEHGKAPRALAWERAHIPLCWWHTQATKDGQELGMVS
jgi:hypothetical protein